MKYISLPPDDEERRLSFYLAMEEYVARRFKEDDLFFMWRVAPSVIFGRNQVMQNEVNLDYCRQHHIHIYRRKSGGGCVYADWDNLMLSFITSGDDVAFNYNRFMGMILLVLRKLGIQATSTQHNDVMIGDRKVSGTAFYQLPGRCVAHATLLYDTNMEHMLNAITPSADKLKKNGIESVRQRITLLKDYTMLTAEQLFAFFKAALCTEECCLMPDDIREIEKIEEGYLREEFINRIL